MKEATQILQQKRISVTQNRIRLLQSFLEGNPTFDQGELFRLLNQEIDRTSIFRNLNLFVRVNILRKIPCTSGPNRYMLDLAKPMPGFDQTTAAMICCKCHDVKIISLDFQPRIHTRIARGFVMQQIVLEGLCKNCR